MLEEANHSRTQKIQFTVIKQSAQFFLVYFQLIVRKIISSRIICKVLAVRAIQEQMCYMVQYSLGLHHVLVHSVRKCKFLGTVFLQ